VEREHRELSFWHDSVPGRLDPRPALQGDIDADVVIVGAGFTGLWTAYYLKRLDPGLDVVMLEAEIAGFGASGRNGGWCAAYVSGIDHWYENPAQREGAVRLQRLMFDAVREVGEVCRKESIDAHFDRSGALEIAVIPQQVRRITKELESLRALGFGDGDYEWLDTAGIRNTLDVDGALAGIHMKHCAAVHPSRLVRGLAATVERMGVTIYESSPVIRAEGREVRTSRGTVNADTVLIATEGYSDSVRGRKNMLIPLHSMMVVTEPLSDDQLEEIRFRRRYCFGNRDWMVTYGQLTADRRIAFGCRGGYGYGSSIWRFDAGNPQFDVVRQTLLRFFPGLDGVSFTHAWGGAMGVSRSLRPAVNFDAARRLGWAGGYFGNGVGAAQLAGRTLADLVLDRDSERVHTPWVNSPTANRRWEPEPLRWMGIRTRARLMQWADSTEYRDSRLAPVITGALERFFP
jgi:glycine/D-amino acid oxidase-like deaminating enzyme